MIDSQLLHEKEIAFFGAITASISHELNNVLSIINEYSGLLSDLVAANTQDIPLDKDKIQKISLNIAEQIKREQNLIKLLNRFAHRFDAPLAEFNLNDLIHDIISISRRFASLKKVSLELTLPEEQIFMTNNPFRIQYAVFSCLKLALGDSKANDCILINLKKSDTTSIIRISSPLKARNEDRDKVVDLISSIIKNVDGNFNDKLVNDNSRIMELLIPLSIPGDFNGNKEDYLNGN